MRNDSADVALQRFFDRDDVSRVAFDDVAGRHYEGYPLDVQAERVLVGLGGPMAPEEPQWFLYASLRRDSIAFWSEREQRWVPLIV